MRAGLIFCKWVGTRVRVGFCAKKCGLFESSACPRMPDPIIKDMIDEGWVKRKKKKKT